MTNKTSHFLSSVALSALCSTFLLGLLACGGAANDPCQQASDCNSGLICCSSTGIELGESGSADFGACRAAGTCSSSTDAGTDADVDSGTAGCSATVSGSCPTGQFCSVASCAAATGQCVTIPTMCIGVVEPVCSCGSPRQTFQNACEAQRASQSSEAGECPADGGMDAGVDADTGDAGVDAAST